MKPHFAQARTNDINGRPCPNCRKRSFSPQNLKMDGSYHTLKVSLKTAAKIPGADLEARKGYYAPTHLENEAENAKREIEEALFSREEVNIPF